MQWASTSPMELPKAADRLQPLPCRTVLKPNSSSPDLLYGEYIHALGWLGDGALSPEDLSPALGCTPSADQLADYPQFDNNLGDRSTPGEGTSRLMDGHVRATSEHTQSSLGLELPIGTPHASSHGSCPDTVRTSGQSSVSSFARRVMRTGPDLRLINVSRTGLAEKFGTGGPRRKSLASLASLKKAKTYEDPNEEMVNVPSPETQAAAPSEPKASHRAPIWFKALRKHESDPEKHIDSLAKTPPLSPALLAQPIHAHSKSENLPTSPYTSIDDSHSNDAPFVGNVSNQSLDAQVGCPSTPSSRKRTRPKFPRWKSHSSHLLKHGKPQSHSPSTTPTGSVAQSPAPVSDDGHKQLALESPKKPPRKSFKRWLWRGPLTSSDAQSISDVITSAEMNAVKPEPETRQGPQHADTPPTFSKRTPRQTRFGTKHQSSESDTPTLPPLSISPAAFNASALFSPNPRSDRRDGSSYFAIDETESPSLPRSKHYTPDHIGTALGGISPLPSPPAPRSPQSAAAPSQPESDEYFQAKMLSNRHATARSSTMPPVFVPPGQTRVNTPPSVKAGRTAAGKPSGFFFEGPAPDHEDNGDESLGAHSPREPSSSGFWDSDAVLMSQSPSVVDAWRDRPPQLAPPMTPDPERDWFRVRMDQIMTKEPKTTGRDVGTDAVGGTAFAWDVPEHLPGSPLCPLSPKHKSGGKGICVYHGRRKTQRFVVSA